MATINAPRPWDAAVLVAFAIAEGDLAAIEVDVIDPAEIRLFGADRPMPFPQELSRLLQQRGFLR